MNYSLLDAGGVLLATLSYIPLLLAPGVAIGAVCDVLNYRRRPVSEQTMVSLLLGLAVLPLLDSYAVRFVGQSAALTLNLILAAVGGVLWMRARRRTGISRLACLLATCWLSIVLVDWIDFDFAGALHQPLLVIDMVKHAATVRAIYETGAPPSDPFFLRSDHASYYYFFYTLGALSMQLCHGLVDSRAAVGGLVFWTGIALFCIARLVLSGAALTRDVDDVRDGASNSRRVQLILAALLLSGGLDILPALKRGLLSGTWLGQPDWWNEVVTAWAPSLLWVPHHVAAMIGGLTGLMVLAQAVQPGTRRHTRGITSCILVASLALASAFGASIWVSLGAAGGGVLWFSWICVERRWPDAGVLACAGGLALVFATPQFLDLAADRTAAALPIAFAVRAFSPLDAAVHREPLRSLGRLIALPVNYFAEFGVFFSGALLFWRGRTWRDVHQSELARVLTLTACSGLLLGSVLKSTLYNNDLGWRVVLFAQFAMLLWTASVFNVEMTRVRVRQADVSKLKLPIFALTLGAIGLATTAYSLLALRFYQAVKLPDEERFINSDPRTDRELRAAYEWANQHLPRFAVLQHNPAPARVFDFGLYSRNPVSLSDSYAGLYGASRVAVTRRFNEVLPIFTSKLSPSEVRARAGASGIDELIVTTDDPIWREPRSWVWTAPAAYASSRVRIVAVARLRARP